jgi:Tol biopolymer transport system component
VRDARSDIPARLSRIVDRCLEPDPADRFPTVAAVAEALRDVSGSAWTTRRALATAAVAMGVVGVSLAFARYGGGPVAPSMPASTTQETLSMRRVLTRGSTSVSADGRYLLGGAVLHDLASGGQRRWHPETETGGLGLDPRISRDGAHVAYEFCTAFQRCELRVMSLTAAGPGPWRTLVRDPDPDVRLQAVDWSPDGQSILAQRLRAGAAREIGIVAMRTGSFRALTRIDWRGTTAFFSPDGHSFAFDVSAGESDGRRDIFVMSVDGGERIPMVVGSANDEVIGWSLHGDQLLFRSDRSGTTDLWAVALSNGYPNGNPERLKAGIGNIRSVGITKAGSLHFRTPANEVDIELASIDLTTGRRVAGPMRPPQSVPGTNLEPAWSQDGKFLAYVSQRAGDGLAGFLVIHSVATGANRELPLRTLAWAQGLSWAPDGRSLVVTAVSLKGGCGLFRVDIQTGEVSPVAYPIPLTFQGAHWSPDGTRLYFQPIGGGIFEWVLAPGVQRTISPAPSREEWQNLGPISVSPDGRWIASYDRPGGLLQAVMIRSIDGGQPREIFRLSDGEFDVIPLLWTPASDAVIARRYTAPVDRETRGGELWLIPQDGTAPRALDIDLTGAISGQLGKIRLSPDGKQLAYVVGKFYQTETWVLENFLLESPAAHRVAATAQP